jgi:5-methylcytosine-specific restriction endonuclease McrA
MVASARSDDAASAPAAPRRSRHLPSATRRAVVERDGLRCTWVGPDGTRCDSQAWLEHDHITPRGQGGSDEPANIRIRCRPHNRLAAEQTYGQQTITRAIADRRASPRSR